MVLHQFSLFDATSAAAMMYNFMSNFAETSALSLFIFTSLNERAHMCTSLEEHANSLTAMKGLLPLLFISTPWAYAPWVDYLELQDEIQECLENCIDCEFSPCADLWEEWGI